MGRRPETGTASDTAPASDSAAPLSRPAATSHPSPAPAVSGTVPPVAHERPTDQLRQMIRDIRPDEVVGLADRIAATTDDPYEVARAALMKLGALIILGRTGECPAVVDQAEGLLRQHPHPALLGEFHALAGWVAHADGSLERSVMHLVAGTRALETATVPDVVAADAWLDLAITYSYLGFHERASYAAGRGAETARAGKLRLAEYACPQILVRSAVSHDHLGDTERCRDELAGLLRGIAELLNKDGGLTALRPDDLPYLEFAVARLAALGHQVPALPLPTAPGKRRVALQEAMDLRRLSAVCRAICARRADEALTRLDRLNLDPRTVGAAEVHRLRAMAYTVAGDHLAADEADRTAFRVASAGLERVRALFVDGIAVRLDHEELQRTVGRYAGEALSDPLTGLANRRSLEQQVERLARESDPGVLGVIDLDGFKAVNTVHGHLTGDLVLQRVAAVLIRTLRRRDFVARYGGDEFVVILPSTTMREADMIGRRLANALREEDWDALVPGTPVSASIGWAELRGPSGLANAFRRADRAMLDAKHAVTERS